MVKQKSIDTVIGVNGNFIGNSMDMLNSWNKKYQAITEDFTVLSNPATPAHNPNPKVYLEMHIADCMEDRYDEESFP